MIPFAILAVAKCGQRIFLATGVFQELSDPKSAKDALMGVDETMTVCSIT
ncbi:DUF3360 family protein [Vibrio vulnificus]